MTQWSNQPVNQWKISESINQCNNESMNHSIIESEILRHSELVIQWINEWRKQCTSEIVNQWIDESKSQWTNDQWITESMTNESLIQWTSGSMDQWTNQWIHESMNPWRKVWVDRWMGGLVGGWVDGWTDGWPATFLCWATSSLSDLFAYAPLLSATSSLSSPLSGLLLLWAAAQLAHFCSSCSPSLFSPQLIKCV